MNTTNFQQDHTEQFPDGDAGLRAHEVVVRETKLDVAHPTAKSSIAKTYEYYDQMGGPVIDLFERRRTAPTHAQIVAKNLLQQEARVAQVGPKLTTVHTLSPKVAEHVNQANLTPQERLEHIVSTVGASASDATPPQLSIAEASQNVAFIHELQIPTDELFHDELDRAA